MKYFPTIHDVAKKSGYSTATVSRVINNQGGVKRDTELKIRNSIKELGYVRNAIARSMVRRETNTIGVLVPDIKNPFFSKIFSSIERKALSEGYFTILSNSLGDEENEKKVLINFIERGIDGLIVTSSNENSDFFNEYISANIPVVALDRPLNNFDFDTVLSGNRDGAYNAVEHLIINGYKKIAIIRGDQKTTPGYERYKGYEDALKKHNIKLESEWIIDGDFGEKSGYNAIKLLHDLKEKPNAIFSCNNLMSIGAMKALVDYNWTIGQSLGFVGYDDIQIATFHKPNLTVVHREIELLGDVAFEFLLNRMKNDNFIRKKQEYILPPKLIVRQSSRR